MTIKHATKPGNRQRQGKIRAENTEYGFLSVVNFPSFARRRDRNLSLGLRTHEIGLCHFVRGRLARWTWVNCESGGHH
jgi:hypothetical protein